MVDDGAVTVSGAGEVSSLDDRLAALNPVAAALRERLAAQERDLAERDAAAAEAAARAEAGWRAVELLRSMLARERGLKHEALARAELAEERLAVLALDRR